MSDGLTLTLNHPLTEEQWDDITDVDFDHTDRIWFHTKHGKDVEFVKRKQWIPCSERLPDESGKYLVTAFEGTVKITTIVLFQSTYRLWGLTGRRAYWKVIAWMPLPDPWEEGYE